MKLMHEQLPREEQYPLPPRQVTEGMAEKAGLGEHLDEDEREAATWASHFAYGAACGALYGALTGERVDRHPVLAGVGFGVAVCGGESKEVSFVRVSVRPTAAINRTGRAFAFYLLPGEPGDSAVCTNCVALEHKGSEWGLRRERGVEPYQSSDPDTARIWWADVGVHQNLTFPVHPDPISGMHCWHQAVRVRKAEAGDSPGDIHVNTERSRAVYRTWLQFTRPADLYSPDGTRRPYWLLRPLKPAREFYRLPEEKVDSSQ
jgi:hypothetical protein